MSPGREDVQDQFDAEARTALSVEEDQLFPLFLEVLSIFSRSLGICEDHLTVVVEGFSDRV